MIEISRTKVYGFEEAVRGMRNSFNSWDQSDSYNIVEEYNKIGDKYGSVTQAILGYSKGPCDEYTGIIVDGWRLGERDMELMNKLYNAGDAEAKFQRFIIVTCDVKAPLYFWKQLDTYKIGTVSNSTSTMHKVMAKPFELDDFSHDKMWERSEVGLQDTIDMLNMYRHDYLTADDDIKKDIWWQVIQLLPSSYNQLRTMQFNYQVLSHIRSQRRGHKLDEWKQFCKWIDNLPYANEIM